MEALELLQENPAIISESYLSPRNGANLICDEKWNSESPRLC